MTVPTVETGLAVAAVYSVASTCGRQARSESECPPSAHSRSRNLLKNIEGLLEQADWLVLTVWKEQQRTQEDLLTTTLSRHSVFFTFLTFKML